MYSIIPQKRTHRVRDNIYTGEEQPTSVTPGTVHIAVVGTQKRPRVVTKTFGVKKPGAIDNSSILTAEKDTSVQAANDLTTGEGEIESDSEDTQDLPPKKVNGHCFKFQEVPCINTFY